jgi:hypothetical protein
VNFFPALHAEPVYQLFSKSFGARKQPMLNHPVHGQIGYHVRNGKHECNGLRLEPIPRFCGSASQMKLFPLKFFTTTIASILLGITIEAEQKPVETIAFGSCLKQTRPQPIWNSVLAKQPDVFLLLGDNIYGDTRDMQKLKDKWDVFSSVPGFKKLRQNSRVLAIWDDHDYGENDAGKEFPKKAESQNIFLDFLSEPANSLRRKTPGIYDSLIVGPPG